MIGNRIRTTKKTKKKDNYFKTEVSLNFKDQADADYYQEIVNIFYQTTGLELVYKIEKEIDDVYSNHLHMGVATDDKNKVLEFMTCIVKENLQRNVKTRFDNFLSVNEMIDDKSFIDYISKGYDGLGGDLPEYILA